MSTETVSGTFGINTPHLESLVAYVNDRGGQISEQKQLKLEDLGLAELEDPKDHFQCLVCSKVIKRKHNAVAHFRKQHSNANQSDVETPENTFGNFEICNSQLASFEAFAEVLGGQISVQKHLKFEDMGLTEVEEQKGHFQCLTCYKVIKRKHNAMTHFRKQHSNANQIELKIQCPRCNTEMSKSNLNPHMDQVHSLKKFDQLVKRSFQPSTSGDVPKKITETEVEHNPLALGNEDLNNNYTEAEDAYATENIKQE